MKNIKNKKSKLSIMSRFKKPLLSVVALGLTLTVASSYAAGASSLTGIASNVDGIAKNVINLLMDMDILASVVFFVIGCLKFRQHTLNAQQVPVGHAIAPICISICLAVFPTLLPALSTSLSGGASGSSSKIGGSNMIKNFSS